MINAIDEKLASLEGGRILDIATGDGGFLVWLMDHLRKCSAGIGIDTSARAVDAARPQLERGDVSICRMDGAQIAFPDATFDTVSISNSLHHLPDPPPVLREMWRVLKPGGTFLLSEMFRDGQTETQETHVLLHHWWAEVDTARGIVHRETYTRQQLLDAVTALPMRRVEALNYTEIDEDPKAPETLHYLDEIIDRYVEFAAPFGNDLQERGAALRRRLHAVGLHWATQIVVIGEKDYQ